MLRWDWINKETRLMQVYICLCMIQIVLLSVTPFVSKLFSILKILIHKHLPSLLWYLNIMFSKTKQHKSRNRWLLCIWRSINIQTTVGAPNTWYHNYHNYLNNFKLVVLIITMLIKRIQTKYNSFLLRTLVTILHSRMQNDKCEYLNINITIKYF